MKDITNKIIESLKGEALSQRNKFLEYAEALEISKNPVEDLIVTDFIQLLNDGLDVISLSSERGILDLLPPNTRRNIFDLLSSLETESKNLFITKSQNGDIAPFVRAGNELLNVISNNSLDILLNEFPDYTQKLKELKDLRKKLIELNSEFNASKVIINNATELFGKVDEAFNKNAEAYNNVNNIKTNAENALKELNIKKTECEKVINDIIAVNQTFEEYVKKITDVETGFSTTIAHVEKTKGDIDKVKIDVQKIYTESTELNKKLQENIISFGVAIGNLQKLEASITSLYEKATNPEEGIEAKLKHIVGVSVQVDDLYSKIKQSHTIANEFGTKIENLHKNSETKLQFIDKAQIESADKKKKIEEIYNIVANTSRGGMFNDARRSFDAQQKSWLKYLAISVALTVIVAISISAYFADRNIATNIFLNYLLRYAILSPLIYAIIFCGKQYKLARTSYEKYTFKTVTSLSLEADITVLQNRFVDKKHEDVILESALQKLTKLYEEPYYDEAAKMKYKIKLDEVRFGKEADDEILSEGINEEVNKSKTGNK
jgi:hypothetical protein